MIIESVAAAGMLLQQINTVIQNVNEGKANVDQAMALVSDFGEALNTFEIDRKSSAFKPLSKNDILKLQMLRRSQERYQKDLRDLLLVADPKLLKDYDEAIMQQERDRKAHQAMLNKKRKEREKLMHDISVGAVALIVGGGVAVGILFLIIKAFGP
jgi:ribosome-binding protein aMBF1 (putative translation factor)